MSITNFYYFEKYKLCNKTDGAALDPCAVADFDMMVVKSNETLPFFEGDSLLELLGGDLERLLMLLPNERARIRARIHFEPFDVEVALTPSGYMIFSPSNPKRRNKIRELEELRRRSMSAAVSACTEAYYRLVSGEKPLPGMCDVKTVMRRISRVVDKVKRSVLREPIDIREQPESDAVIRCTNDDFFKLIVSATTACYIMSGRNNVPVELRINDRVAAFGAAFRSNLPPSVRDILIEGRLDDVRFDASYGNLFLILSYIRELCEVYGYTFAIERERTRMLRLTITVPLVAKVPVPEIGVHEFFNEVEALAFAYALLGA